VVIHTHVALAAWIRILQKFEHDSHALGFCMLCGTCIVYEGGNCVAAHKPGCLWGRAVKSSEFLSEAKIIFYGDLSESSFGRITFATDKELEGICREYVAAHTCENLDVKGESVCSIDWVSVSTLNSDGTAGADIAVYRYDYLDNDWKWEMK